mmetsp:Transcript_28790/g.58962  ORF Transcript_28790/g.58962 Transcript_28790/m.58962 type:complete len:212 (-) Transcript_28790:706-1341(-)
MSFPEHPIMIESILILLIANTTSVPTITPPASSMYWSTTITSNLSFPQITRASSPVDASVIVALGAIPLLILLLNIDLFIATSSIKRNDKVWSIRVFESSFTTTSGGLQTANGIFTTQDVPGLIVGSLWKQIDPPVRSTRCFAIASPRPVPGAPPRWTKRSNSLFCSLRGIPGPVSAHSNRTYSCSHSITRVMEPEVVYLMAFVTTFVMTC